MKGFNAVRWAAFLMTLLANADVAEAQMLVDRSTTGRHAKCERCGETGPTVPIAPVVFGAGPAVSVEVPRGAGDARLGTNVQHARPSPVRPVRGEFALDSARPAVGVAVTQ